MHNIRTWIGVAALASVSACASTQTQHPRGATVSSAAGDVVAAAEEVPVRVSNHNWSDIVVYAVHSGTRYRLGDVASMTTRLLTIPKGVVSSLDGVQLLADPIGSEQSYVTQPIVTAPGDAIEFNVENQLSISSYNVGARSDLLSTRPKTPR